MLKLGLQKHTVLLMHSLRGVSPILTTSPHYNLHVGDLTAGLLYWTEGYLINCICSVFPPTHIPAENSSSTVLLITLLFTVASEKEVINLV